MFHQSRSLYFKQIRNLWVNLECIFFKLFVFVFASEHWNDYTLRETRYQLVHKSRRIFGREDDRYQPVTETSTKEPRSPTKRTGRNVRRCVHLSTYRRGPDMGVVRPSTARFPHSLSDQPWWLTWNHHCDSTWITGKIAHLTLPSMRLWFSIILFRNVGRTHNGAGTNFRHRFANRLRLVGPRQLLLGSCVTLYVTK